MSHPNDGRSAKMRAQRETTKVLVIPLAEKGFIPVSDSNPVRWYIERIDTGKFYSIRAYSTKADAEQAARNLGFEVEE